MRKLPLDELASLIGETVPRVRRTRAGDYWAICPNHADHHPSLHIFRHRTKGHGLFYCQVCQSDFMGDSADWMRLVLKMSWREILRGDVARPDPEIIRQRDALRAQRRALELARQEWRDAHPHALPEESLFIDLSDAVREQMVKILGKDAPAGATRRLQERTDQSRRITGRLR